MVTDVRPDGPAVDAGVHKGDVLIGLHQFAMTTPDNVMYVLNLPDLATLNPLHFYILATARSTREPSPPPTDGWVTVSSLLSSPVHG